MGVFPSPGAKEVNMARHTEKSGESIDEAIVISDVKNNLEGIAREYDCLEWKFGKRGIDWDLELQTLIVEGDKQYDRMALKFPDGTNKTIYFDISSFF
jgi:hypothetical protein|tara:strand:+ start:272 stop:565 length:294 start_codon:yes stop_codon:yes gene_type:complete